MDFKDKKKISKSFSKYLESAIAVTDLSGQVKDTMAMQQAMQYSIAQEKVAVFQNQKQNSQQKASEYASKEIESGYTESQKNQKPNPNKMEKKDTPQRKNATGQNGSSGSSYNTNVKTSFGKVQPSTPQRKASSSTPQNNTGTPTRKESSQKAMSGFNKNANSAGIDTSKSKSQKTMNGFNQNANSKGISTSKSRSEEKVNSFKQNSSQITSKGNNSSTGGKNGSPPASTSASKPSTNNSSSSKSKGQTR